MVPWPIALLTLWYAVIASTSAATMWKIASGLQAGSLVWPAMWAVASAGVIVGLALLKPWGRRLALWIAVALLVSALASALARLAQAEPSPRDSLLATGMAVVQVIVIRYVTRPHVKKWFTMGDAWPPFITTKTQTSPH